MKGSAIMVRLLFLGGSKLCALGASGSLVDAPAGAATARHGAPSRRLDKCGKVQHACAKRSLRRRVHPPAHTREYTSSNNQSD